VLSGIICQIINKAPGKGLMPAADVSVVQSEI